MKYLEEAPWHEELRLAAELWAEIAIGLVIYSILAIPMALCVVAVIYAFYRLFTAR